jgi:hypothetical protein
MAMPKLVMLDYWKLPRSPLITEIKNRLLDVYSDQITPPVWLPEPMDSREVAASLGLQDNLPFQAELETELQTSLQWIRVRLGEKEALKFLRQDWIVHGSCIVFAQKEPCLEMVRAAVEVILLRQKFVET